MTNDEHQEVDLEKTTNEEAESELEVVEESHDDDDDRDWKADALKYKAILDRNKKKVEEKKEVVVEKKSYDFGYDVKSYLKSSGINASEFDFVKKELKAYGGDVDSLIENEYFQDKLKKHRDLSKTADATPKGKRTGSPATDSVDYWMNKPFADVPADMKSRVVNARIDKEKNKGIFYNS